MAIELTIKVDLSEQGLADSEAGECLDAALEYMAYGDVLDKIPDDSISEWAAQNLNITDIWYVEGGLLKDAVNQVELAPEDMFNEFELREAIKRIEDP